MTPKTDHRKPCMKKTLHNHASVFIAYSQITRYVNESRSRRVSIFFSHPLELNFSEVEYRECHLSYDYFKFSTPEKNSRKLTPPTNSINALFLAMTHDTPAASAVLFCMSMCVI